MKTILFLLAALLAACTSLPPASDATSADWTVLSRTNSSEVRIRSGTPAQALAAPRLGEIRIATVPGEDDKELEALRQKLADTLKTELAPGTRAATLNVTLSDPRPVSPALNVASALLLFVPLDTGSIRIEAELVSPEGSRIALWREQLSGSVLDLSGSLSRWARIRHALELWAKRCAHQPPWSEGIPAS